MLHLFYNNKLYKQQFATTDKLTISHFYGNINFYYRFTIANFQKSTIFA